MRSTHSFPTDLAPPGRLLEIRRLLDTAFDGDFTDDDWEHSLGGTHVCVEEDGRIAAHAAVVTRAIQVGDRTFAAGYVEGVATDPSAQGTGFGSLAMRRIGIHVAGAHQLGVLGTGAHHFYERLGWERWRGPSFVRHGSELVRTEDDDDGIMVLRFGPSRAIDLTAPITCEARSGDDW